MDDKNLDKLISEVLSENVEPSYELLESTKRKVKGIKRKNHIIYLFILSIIMFLFQVFLIIKFSLNVYTIAFLYSIFTYSITVFIVSVYYYKKSFLRFITRKI